VTVDLFQQFRADHYYLRRIAPTVDCPVYYTTWYLAAEYCNWLSAQEGIGQDQWCYEPNLQGQYSQGMKLKANYLSLTGYRLPTEAEWEYACRARAETSRYYGESTVLLGKYGVYLGNSGGGCWPVGSLNLMLPKSAIARAGQPSHGPSPRQRGKGAAGSNSPPSAARHAHC
jgi:hypothetical protein